MSSVKKQQLAYYRTRTAGCVFAAICARNPEKYGWKHVVFEAAVSEEIDKEIELAVSEEKVTTLSLLFPRYKSSSELISLTENLQKCEFITLALDNVHDGSRCLGFRVIVGEALSWVSGFGNFDFLPKTRQAPHVELVFRVKPRPLYDWYMAKPVEGIIHLADTDMLSVPKRVFRKWWNASFKNTKHILGHSPNIHSAAKTTFSIPSELFKDD